MLRVSSPLLSWGRIHCPTVDWILPRENGLSITSAQYLTTASPTLVSTVPGMVPPISASSLRVVMRTMGIEHDVSLFNARIVSNACRSSQLVSIMTIRWFSPPPPLSLPAHPAALLSSAAPSVLHSASSLSFGDVPPSPLAVPLSVSTSSGTEWWSVMSTPCSSFINRRGQLGSIKNSTPSSPNSKWSRACSSCFLSSFFSSVELLAMMMHGRPLLGSRAPLVPGWVPRRLGASGGVTFCVLLRCMCATMPRRPPCESPLNAASPICALSADIGDSLLMLIRRGKTQHAIIGISAFKFTGLRMASSNISMGRHSSSDSYPFVQSSISSDAVHATSGMVEPWYALRRVLTATCTPVRLGMKTSRSTSAYSSPWCESSSILARACSPSHAVSTCT
mmetsp:Transcript_38662/g.105002  ORF Transcript_38662/g.105002 Transcript_38662/m.105002 type:complete len:393 (+) Transcript_38662:266-1444(+)